MRPFKIPPRVVLRLKSHVETTDNGCVLSLYSTASHGYAQIGWVENGKRTMTLCHRVAWVSEHGAIPEGMTVDHLCKNRRCINVDHLRLLSNYENARRTHGRDWPLGQCVNGHPNSFLRRVRGRVHCAECYAEWQRGYRRRKREAAEKESGVA